MKFFVAGAKNPEPDSVAFRTLSFRMVLIIPQEELKRIVADEVEAFGKELPYRTEFPSLGSEHDADSASCENRS